MQQATAEAAAKAVLDTRSRRSKTGAMLADRYDPPAAPRDLVKARAQLDGAVDRCYRAQPFNLERRRVEFLFTL